MFLSKQQYYNRRWFLSILFILVGFLLFYLGCNMLLFNKGKDELDKINETPSLIQIEKKDIGNSPSLILSVFYKRTKKETVISEFEVDKLALLFNQPDLNAYSFGNKAQFKGSQLANKTYRYTYYNDKLYELKINDIDIVNYKQNKPILGYVILIISILWMSFQVRSIFILITRGTKVYDDFD